MHSGRDSRLSASGEKGAIKNYLIVRRTRREGGGGGGILDTAVVLRQIRNLPKFRYSVCVCVCVCLCVCVLGGGGGVKTDTS